MYIHRQSNKKEDCCFVSNSNGKQSHLVEFFYLGLVFRVAKNEIMFLCLAHILFLFFNTLNDI